MYDMLLSIIIPVYNEKNFVEEVIKRVLEAPYDKEIIIVDDWSTDGTREILNKILNNEYRITNIEPEAGKLKKQNLNEIKVIFHEKNLGKGGAVRTGVSVAKGDIVIIQDADLEYDPQEFNLMIEPVIKGFADVVYGSRFMGGTPHRVLFFWHTIGNKFLTFLSNVFSNLNLTDMETCYKLFKSDIIKKIKLNEKRFGFEPEITQKISRIKNIRIYEVGISYYGRTYEEGKKINWKDGFRAIYCIVKYGIFYK